MTVLRGVVVAGVGRPFGWPARNLGEDACFDETLNVLGFFDLGYLARSENRRTIDRIRLDVLNVFQISISCSNEFTVVSVCSTTGGSLG